MRVVTSSQMKQMERNALAFDLTYHRLMENAGAAAAAFIRRTFKIAGRNCIIFCARGNNGGDGLVVARKLAEQEVNVLVVLVEGPPSTEEAAAMYQSVEMMGLPVIEYRKAADKIAAYLTQTDLVVDAICGTGFSGSLRETHRPVCEAINDATAAVVALDIPTGVECDSGRIAEGAVAADFTLAFDSLKPCHILPESKAQCGVVEVLDIGIPDEARSGVNSLFGVASTEQVFERIPTRPPEAHKGSFGRLLNIAGSLPFRGAAALSTEAALRCGAGIVTLASVEPVCATVAARTPEAVLLPLAHNDIGTVDGTVPLSALTEQLARATAVVFGCGLGNNLHTAHLLELVLKHTTCPLLIDADGINALAGNIHVLSEARAPIVLTPHPGEMARLCGLSVEEIERDRVGAALRFSERHNLVVLLKGQETVVAAPDGTLRLNRTGNAGLARGGSGDLLSGMIGAFLAQGMAPLDAAVCGAHLHGLAADRCAARLSQTAMLPSDLLADLGAIFLAQGR